MVLNREKRTIEHHQFKDVINFFDEGDVMVLNNTKVFPARLFGNKEKRCGIEVFLLRELNEEQRLWDVLVDPARKIELETNFILVEDDSLVAEVIDNTTSRGRTLVSLFDGSQEEFRMKQRIWEKPHFLNTSNATPLQTIKPVTKPFTLKTKELLQHLRLVTETPIKRLEIKGVDLAELTFAEGTENL